MKRLSLLLLSLAVAALMVQAPAAHAQEPSGTLQIHLRTSPVPPVVPPAPSPEVLNKDLDEAVTTIKDREKAEEVAREAARGFERQPNLNHDVVQGIQSMGIQDALRRR